MQVNRGDRQILRDLAKRVAEIAAEPVQEQRKREWFRHNALKKGKPLVLCDPQDGWMELIPDDDLRAGDPVLRTWEMELRRTVYSWEHFDDDQVTESFFDVAYVCSTSGWGVEPEIVPSTEARGAYRWIPAIRSR